MKKLQYALIGLVIMLPLMLSSCTDRNYWEEEPLYGNWFMNNYDPDLGSYECCFSFYADGTCDITYTYDFFPQYNNSYTVNYRVSGDLYYNAVIDMWGFYPDGAFMDNSYQASINYNTLYLYGIEGDYTGLNLVFTR